MKKPLLITGVSSGIGLAMARKFLAKGFRVFGSVRSQAKADELQAALGESFTPLVFDICKQDELENAEKILKQALGDQHLVALINNAGSAEIGPLLHVPLDDFRQQLDTLVVGQLGVIQRFYSYLIPKSGTDKVGRIINISSVSGVHANPFFGCYAAGKHALEGLSKTLRHELQSLGIRVVVVAPANIATSIWPKQTRELIDRYKDTTYYRSLQQALEHIGRSVVKHAMSVDEFADALYEIFVMVEPADRYTLAKSKSRRNPFSGERVRLIEG